MASLGVAKVAELVVRYVSVGEEIAMHELKVPVVVNLVSADEAAAGVDRQVVEEVVVLTAARAQEEARKAADSGDYEVAQKVLGEAAQRLRASAAGSARAEELERQADEMEGNGVLFSTVPMSARQKKKMLFESYTRKRGRKPPPQPE